MAAKPFGEHGFEVNENKFTIGIKGIRNENPKLVDRIITLIANAEGKAATQDLHRILEENQEYKQLFESHQAKAHSAIGYNLGFHSHFDENTPLEKVVKNLCNDRHLPDFMARFIKVNAGADVRKLSKKEAIAQKNKPADFIIKKYPDKDSLHTDLLEHATTYLQEQSLATMLAPTDHLEKQGVNITYDGTWHAKKTEKK